MFADFDRQLKARGYLPMGGQIVDATLVAASKQRNKDLEQQEEKLDLELANLPERTVVRLRANYEAAYRSAIAELDLHLASREASPT